MTTEPENLRPRSNWLTPVSILLVSRLGVWLIAYLGLAVMHAPRQTHQPLPGNLLLDGWTKWDGQWYARLATQGYTGAAADGSGQRDVVQFPLYPWTVRAVSWLIGDVYVAGILVSNVCFVAAGVLLWKLIERQFDSDVARRAIVLWCVWPFSYTFSAMYTESLFMLCVAAAFILGQKRIWPAAALFAAAAGMARVIGTATAVALAVMYLQSINWRVRHARWNALWLLLGLAGIAGYMLMLAIRFHEPLAFLHAQSAGGWGDFNSLDEFKDIFRQWRVASFGNFASGNVPLLATLHIITMLIAGVLGVIGLRKLPLSWSIWAILVVLASYYRWACFGRHFSTVWPAFVVAALLIRKSSVLYHGIVYLCALVLALLTIMFTQGYWVA